MDKLDFLNYFDNLSSYLNIIGQMESLPTHVTFCNAEHQVIYTKFSDASDYRARIILNDENVTYYRRLPCNSDKAITQQMIQNLPGTPIHVRMGDCLHYIEDNAFKDCTDLEVLQGGKNLETIGESAFENCRLLNNSGPGYNYIGLDCNSIGDNAFKGCINMSVIFLYSEELELGENVFTNDSSLMAIYINDKIYDEFIALPKYDKLKKVLYKTSDSNKVIATFEIDDISTPTPILNLQHNIIEIEIDGIIIDKIRSNTYQFTETGEHTVKYTLAENSHNFMSSFANLHNLTELILPSNIYEIDSDAFKNDSSLKALTIMGQAVRINGNSFTDVSLTNIYVSSNSVNDYKRKWFFYQGIITVFDNGLSEKESIL